VQLRGGKTHEDQPERLCFMPSKDATLQGVLQARQVGVLACTDSRMEREEERIYGTCNICL